MPDDAQVIVQKIEEEKSRIEAERRRAEEQVRREAEERKKRKLEMAEAKKQEAARLKTAGLWTHPSYKTLKAAYADGWRQRQEDEVGGEEMSLKGRTLVRNALRQRYVYKTTLSKVYGLTAEGWKRLGNDLFERERGQVK